MGRAFQQPARPVDVSRGRRQDVSCVESRCNWPYRRALHYVVHRSPSVTLPPVGLGAEIDVVPSTAFHECPNALHSPDRVKLRHV